MADDVKQVKVDNWGIYFLQRLKHFFNRTDYCDLTLQFQDNAQLKVHRLVLSACTEYFELLERTCEMYEDCLVMPDDLQADIVVPIVNFMYTGQLEFKMDILDKLHQCSEIMNMPVLTKLLDSHRPKPPKITQSYSTVRRVPKRVDGVKETIKSISATEIVTTAPVTYKRSHNKTIEKTTIYRDRKVYLPVNKPTLVNHGGRMYRDPSPIPFDPRFNKKVISSDPRPTRYELPEELDSENLFSSSFCNISYTSQPLMIHPETRKQYAKRPRLVGEASTSKKMGNTTVDIIECKKAAKPHEDSLFEDSTLDDSEMFSEQTVKTESSRDSNQLFDQILDKQHEAKVTIDTKNNKPSGNLDHAKIISEVLKKYPHLVKSNKNIKLKILNTPSKNLKKTKVSPAQSSVKTEKEADYTFETDVLDSKQAARLIAMGAENIEGPWICLICGAPGKAMNFTSYLKFRRHLVNVHNEKPVLNICEYCGQRSNKRNYLMHHMYTKHGVEPPPQYHFPKCTLCSYIALTEALLVKHKASHVESKNFRCNVCPSVFHSSHQLLMHIQNTGHKYSAERKTNLQCIYCQKVFMREGNLYAHLKTHHSKEAVRDGIIDDCEDEPQEKKNIIKSEPNVNDYEELDIQYQIQQRPDGNITVVPKKASELTNNTKQKILNAGLSAQVQPDKNRVQQPSINSQNEYIQEIHMSSDDTHEEIVMIDNVEYIMKDNQLIPRRPRVVSEEFILSDHGDQSATPTTTMEFTNIHSDNIEENVQHTDMLLKDSENLAQSIPIYVSNEEEYKAIMANQPIIFDSNNSNKTLTVLSAPHTTTLETTAMDLDTTHSNDMMIIQNEYPLNVSEAMTSENSNIVVVYSHQVDDQNKQYQLLTTQALGAQFVQSSSIITQNYETITTAAPVINAHVLEKQGEQVWQSNIQQIVNTDQIEITPIPSHQSVVKQTDQVQITGTIESANDTCDLPHVELTSNNSETTKSNINIPISNQCQDMVAEDVMTTENLNENTEEGCADNVQDMEIIEEGPVDETENVAHSISSLEVIHEGPIEESEANVQNMLSSMEVVHEGLIEETVDSAEPTDTSVDNLQAEIISENNTMVEETEIIELQTLTQTEPIDSQTYTQIEPLDSQTYTQTEISTETAIENTEKVAEHQQSEELSKGQTAAEVDNIQKNNENDNVSGPNNTSDVSMNVEQVLTEDAAEKVQTLTTEWVEDQQENHLAETTLDDNNDVQNNSETCEIEESIENIQQEVDKQMSALKSADQENEDDEEMNDATDSSQDESGHVQEKSVTVITDPAVAQEKISSLLNDWEDNDSQEDNDPVTEHVASGSGEIVKSTQLEVTENPDKQDKIKSLVSDWDEDDEENK